jgi:AcrR family transcriptional regulator
VADEVKRRGYRTPRRGEQARATRRRIVDAARLLFLQNGYAATTLEEIATDAGVAVQTVYFHFGNKRTVLKEVMDVASVGDDEPVPLLQRELFDDIRNESDPYQALSAWVEVSQSIYERVAPLLSVVRDAAGSDVEMAAQWATNRDQRLTAHRHLADLLADKGGLRPDLSVEKAGDIVFTLLSPEVFVLLTNERGWTPDEWRQWVNANLADTLLGKRPPRTRNSKRGQTHPS